MIPIGTILFAFNEYDNILFCDGRKLPINEYKEFADFCIKQYGKANYFGGDGIKSIGLPDIQGCSIVVRDIENRTEEIDNTEDNVNKDIKMTLDEAIKHAEEVAEKNEKQASWFWCKEGNPNYENCVKCAEEHRQLAEWLRELKKYRESSRTENRCKQDADNDSK